MLASLALLGWARHQLHPPFPAGGQEPRWTGWRAPPSVRAGDSVVYEGWGEGGGSGAGGWGWGWWGWGWSGWWWVVRSVGPTALLLPPPGHRSQTPAFLLLPQASQTLSSAQPLVLRDLSLALAKPCPGGTPNLSRRLAQGPGPDLARGVHSRRGRFESWGAGGSRAQHRGTGGPTMEDMTPCSRTGLLLGWAGFGETSGQQSLEGRGESTRPRTKHRGPAPSLCSCVSSGKWPSLSGWHLTPRGPRGLNIPRV